MELRINRDLESPRDVRSHATEGTQASPVSSGESAKGAQPSTVVSVESARRQVEAENLEAANNRVRDPAIAIELAAKIRTQITARSRDAVEAQAAGVSPQALRTLVHDEMDPGKAFETGA